MPSLVTLNTLPLDATVHYPFHPYFKRTFKVLRRSSSVRPQVTLEKSPGKTFTVPLWMTDPAAQDLTVSRTITIESSICLEIVALLEANCFAVEIFSTAEPSDGPTTAL